jgi:diacylglycerol kinase (ATP)
MNTETTRELKDQMGRFAYPVGMIRALTKAQRVQYKMTIDGETVELEGIDCFVVNASRIHSIMGATFADGVSSTDGLLDVFISNSNVNTALLAVSRILQLEENWGVDHWQGREITIETAVPRKVWCDGEDFGDTPVTITVEPGAVNVLCLPPADSAPDNDDPEAKEEIPAPPEGKPMNQ